MPVPRNLDRIPLCSFHRRGRISTLSGITSGVDATLHLLARRNGQVVRDNVAEAMHYPASPFVDSPQLAQYTPDQSTVPST